MSRHRRSNRCIHVALAHCLHRHRSRQHRTSNRTHRHRKLARRNHPELPAHTSIIQVIHRRVVGPHRRRSRIRDQRQTQRSIRDRRRSRPARHRLSGCRSKRRPAHNHGPASGVPSPRKTVSVTCVVAIELLEPDCAAAVTFITVIAPGITINSIPISVHPLDLQRILIPLSLCSLAISTRSYSSSPENVPS